MGFDPAWTPTDVDSGQNAWIQIPALPLPSFETLGMLLTSLSLSFFIYKVGIIIVPIPLAYCGGQLD